MVQATLDLLDQVGLDGLFDFGLELWLRGLERRAAGPPRAP